MKKQKNKLNNVLMVTTICAKLYRSWKHNEHRKTRSKSTIYRSQNKKWNRHNKISK